MYDIKITAAAAVLCAAAAAAGGVYLVLCWLREKRLGNGNRDPTTVPAQHIAELKKNFKLRKKLRNFLGTGKVKREIAEGTSLIRNRIAACGGRRLTTDVMLEELIANTQVLKYAYSRMLSLVRTEERGRAIDEFVSIAGSRHAREYASMIVMLDDMDPRDVYDGIVSFQRDLTEERITEIKKRDEMMSDILYLPVVLNVMLILVDFVYVTYFLQQQELLEFIM